MKVKMLVGSYVQGAFRKEGETLEVPDGIALSMIRTGRAKALKSAKREKAAKEPDEKAAVK